MMPSRSICLVIVLAAAPGSIQPLIPLRYHAEYKDADPVDRQHTCLRITIDSHLAQAAQLCHVVSHDLDMVHLQHRREQT